jgi:hypothetical protein
MRFLAADVCQLADSKQYFSCFVERKISKLRNPRLGTDLSGSF